MPTFLRRLVAVLPVTALVIGGSVLVHADPAEAFGYNRAVQRTCGSNWVLSSGSLSSGTATTSQYSGSCKDVLYAGLNKEGHGVQWAAGVAVNSLAKIDRTQLGDTTGRHKGCQSCAVTLS